MPVNGDLSIENRKNRLWFRFQAPITRDNFAQLRKTIESAVEGKTVHAVFDFSTVAKIDSMVINLVINAKNALEKSQGSISLVNLSRTGLNLFQLTNLDKVITIYRSENDIQ